MDRVEAYQSLSRDSVLHQILKPAIAEYPLDEVLPKRWIREPPFLLDGNQWKLLYKGLREDSGAAVARHALYGVHAHPFDPATGRASLEDIPREVQCSE